SASTFFFRAEDGIRARTVTGVQTCALPISAHSEPGEFTMRGFLNGRIDLTQAEAVRDLIDSQTLFQAKAAAQQLSGALSRRIAQIGRASCRESVEGSVAVGSFVAQAVDGAV